MLIKSAIRKTVRPIRMLPPLTITAPVPELRAFGTPIKTIPLRMKASAIR
jgi:hypothetical protein